jgi:hypothetical protein
MLPSCILVPHTFTYFYVAFVDYVQPALISFLVITHTRFLAQYIGFECDSDEIV